MRWTTVCIKRCSRFYSGIDTVRNIGIIAHIDAGKTTTTERMLYYSGKINRIGNVDYGDTMTDFLPQERSRGITIQSACISFNWQTNGRINLIDTPGHADFSFEVIRSLKVLDGCVAILDAVSGVESQTEKVWKMSRNIPKICFINKMDRVGAGYSRTVKEMITRLHTRAILINIPTFKKNEATNDFVFDGVIDVVNQKKLEWISEDLDKIRVSDILSSTNNDDKEQLNKCRESLIETLTEFDEELVDHFFSETDGDYSKLSADTLNKSIRKCTISNYVTPVLCGASFRNIGVQPLLDAIVNYLPSPLEANAPDTNIDNIPISFDSKAGMLINNNKNFCVAFAFKVGTDAIRGAMVFIRVYSGILKSGHTVYNSTTGNKFKIGKLVVMNANIPEEIEMLCAGQIGVLMGSTIMGNISTGDTILSHSIKKDGIRSLNREKELKLQINPIDIPPPVFSVSIEPKSLGNKDVMEQALKRLTMEDPSLRITIDTETGQTLLSGLGELHLEIAGDKLLNEMNAEVTLGKVSVSYKETIEHKSIEYSFSNDTGYKFTVDIEPVSTLQERISESSQPCSDKETYYPLNIDNNYLIMEKNPKFDPSKEWKALIPYEYIVNAIQSSVLVALQRGGKIAHFPLHSCAIRVRGDWQIPVDMEKPSEILRISRNLILNALNDINDEEYCILEPIMDIHISLSSGDMGNVVQDLTSDKNATIISIEDAFNIENMESNIDFCKIAEKQYLPPDQTVDIAQLGSQTDDNKIIHARAPLKNMIAYNNKLRSLTKGRSDLFMTYFGMEKVAKNKVENILLDF